MNARATMSRCSASCVAPEPTAGEELARALSAVGFVQVEVEPVGEEAIVSARLG